MRENSNFRRNLLPRRMFFAFRFINNNSLRDTRIPAECFCFSVSKENALVYPRTLANPLRFFHFEEKRFNRSEGGILFSIKTISLTVSEKQKHFSRGFVGLSKTFFKAKNKTFLPGNRGEFTGLPAFLRTEICYSHHECHRFFGHLKKSAVVAGGGTSL